MYVYVRRRQLKVDLAKCKLCVTRWRCKCMHLAILFKSKKMDPCNQFCGSHRIWECSPSGQPAPKKKREKIQQNISSGHSEWPLKNQKTTKKTSFLAKEIKDVDPIFMRRKSAFWHSFGETAGFFTPMIHSFSRFEHPKKKRLPFSSGQKQTHPMHYREILWICHTFWLWFTHIG